VGSGGQEKTFINLIKEGVRIARVARGTKEKVDRTRRRKRQGFLLPRILKGGEAKHLQWRPAIPSSKMPRTERGGGFISKETNKKGGRRKISKRSLMGGRSFEGRAGDLPSREKWNQKKEKSSRSGRPLSLGLQGWGMWGKKRERP